MANDVRANIVKSSLVLFADHGFEGASIREIAKAAEIRLPMIYHYFADKQAVYNAAVEEAFSYSSKKVLQALKSTAGEVGEARLRRFLEKYVNHLGSTVAEVRLIDREMMEAKPEIIAKLSVELWRGPNSGMAEILGEIAPDANLPLITEYLSATTYGIVKLRKLDAAMRGRKGLADVESIVDTLVAITLTNLRHMPFAGRSAAGLAGRKASGGQACPLSRGAATPGCKPTAGRRSPA